MGSSGRGVALSQVPPRVSFPQLSWGARATRAVMRTAIGEHDVHSLTVPIGQPPPVVAPGTPALVEWRGRSWPTYFAGVEREDRVGHHLTLLGASFVLKQRAGAVYSNARVGEVAASIAARSHLRAVVDDDPLVFEQVPSGALTDWEVLRWLARESRRLLRCRSMTVFLCDPQSHALRHAPSAPAFYRGPTGAPLGEGNSIVRFNYSPPSIVGGGVEYDLSLGAVGAGGVYEHTYDPGGALLSRTVGGEPRTVGEAEGLLRAASEPYPARARATLVADAGVQAGWPVWLEGLPSGQNGVWMVLSADHSVAERELASTMVELGRGDWPTLRRSRSDPQWVSVETLTEYDYTPRLDGAGLFGGTQSRWTTW